MSGVFVRADGFDDIVSLDVRSRFSMSSVGSHSPVDLEEQQASDDQGDVIAAGQHTPLDKSANCGNGVPQPIARVSLLRHPSRRKGLVFPLSAPVTAELAPGALDFANDDDTESETSSDDFDTTLRPQDMILSQRMSTENRETDLLMRESLDTIRPVIVKKALSASRLLSQAYPASGIPSPVLSPHFGHGSRRKPVPKLEDYDRLYPTQHQPKTVTTDPSYNFPRSVPIECRPIIPSSETERDTVRSKSRLPRFYATHLRESSPLRKNLLSFVRNRQTATMPSTRNFNMAQSQPKADYPPPRLGSPIVLSPAVTPSRRARTSSSPPQPTLGSSPDLSYDAQYLSPSSININDVRFNPMSSIVSMSSTPGSTPGISSQFDNPHTPRSLGLVTPSTSGSVSSTPSRRRIIAFGTTPSSSELGLRASSRCSTPVHLSTSALSLRSIASKVMTLPSTIMKRTSSSQTVTQVAYTPSFPRTASLSPRVLGSAWMSSSDPDDTIFPGLFSCYANSSEMHQFNSVPNSRDPPRTVSPLPPPSFPSQSGAVNSFTPESPKINLAPSHVSSTSWLPRSPPSMSPCMRQQSDEEAATIATEGSSAYFLGRCNPSARVEGIFVETTSDHASRLRSRSEDASTRPREGSNSKRDVKHKGSFRNFLGLVKRPPAEEEVSSGGSSDHGHQNHTRSSNDFLRPAIEGQKEIIGTQDHKAGLVNQVPSFGNGLGLSHSESGWHRERLEMEIIMTRCFVELLDAEHARDYKRVQAMIGDVRNNIGWVQVPNEESNDGEESIVDSYLQLQSHGCSVEDAYDSDYSLQSHSRTLRAGDIAANVSSLDQKPRDTRGGELGHWHGMEYTDDIRS